MAKILSEQEIESMQSSVKALASSVEDSKKAASSILDELGIGDQPTGLDAGTTSVTSSYVSHTSN